MSHSWQNELRQIEAFLREWDPIGLGDDVAVGGPAQDEYDSYAPHVHTLLVRGVSEAELADHLSDLAENRMGMRSKRMADRDTAAKILAWWAGRRGLSS